MYIYKTASFRYILQKYLWRNLFMGELQSVRYKQVTLLKNSIIYVFLRHLQTFANSHFS